MHLPMKVKLKKEMLMVWVFLLFQMDLLMKAKLRTIKFGKGKYIDAQGKVYEGKFKYGAFIKNR